MLRKVVLPDPEAPMMAVSCPALKMPVALLISVLDYRVLKRGSTWCGGGGGVSTLKVRFLKVMS